MAVNKRKVLEAARKHAQKGAKEKALKEYNTLLQLDPKDAKLLLEIGDAHRRWGQTEEAIAQYQRVAQQYRSGGFDARAVAVFKQILNLDSKRNDAHVSLGELYQRMGLDAEAVNSLQIAADGYHKEGQKREALELLRKMATLDPTNTTSRLKVANLLQQEAMLDDAISEYETVVEELIRQGANDQVPSIYERILEIKPDRIDLRVKIAECFLADGTPERAEPHARQAFDATPDHPNLFDMLASIYTTLEKETQLADITRTMAQIYKDRGDDDNARLMMQRLPVSNGLDVSADDPEIDLDLDLERELIPDDEILEDDFLAASDGGEVAADLGGDELKELDLGKAGTELVADDELPEGDPDQLFAEASVYLRYGKREQAIASLKAILQKDPAHRNALEKIGECYADLGNVEIAVEYWIQAYRHAMSNSDDSSIDVLRERIAAIDPEAAAGLVPETVADADEEIGLDEDIPELGLDVEIDFSEDELAGNGVDLESIDEVQVEVDSPDQADADEGLGLDPGADDPPEIAEELEEAQFYFDQRLHDEAAAIYERILEKSPEQPDALERLEELKAVRNEATSEVSAEADEETALLDTEHDISVEVGVNTSATEIDIGADSDFELIDDVDFDEHAAPPDETSVEITDELSSSEEADQEAAIEIEIGDIDNVLSGDTGEGEAGDVAADEAENTELGLESVELGADDAATGKVEFTTEEFSFDDIEVTAAKDEIDEVEIVIPEQDISVSAEEGSVADTPRRKLADDTIPIVAGDDDEDDTEDAVAVESTGVEAHTSEALEVAAVEVVEEAVEEADDDSFDLAAELRESLEEEENANESSFSEEKRTVEEDGFASIFKDFKAGVSKTLTEDDHETRFDLGIAYREMELYDDAIGEFRICLGSTSHRLESLHMMGLCAMDLERPTDAVNHFEQALATADLVVTREAGLRFDLGRAFEQLADHHRAREAFEVARAGDPSIPGLDDCIARSEAALEASGTAEIQDASLANGEELESFEDLLAAVEAEGEPEVEEVFENFDDLIADAEAVGVAEMVLDEADAGKAEVAPEPEPEAPGKSKKKAAKKKRISFV